MTKTEREQFNRMRAALLRISKGYLTLAQLERKSESYYGLEYAEALEYAYENIQGEAKDAVKGVREIKDRILPNRILASGVGHKSDQP